MVNKLHCSNGTKLTVVNCLRGYPWPRSCRAPHPATTSAKSRLRGVSMSNGGRHIGRMNSENRKLYGNVFISIIVIYSLNNYTLRHTKLIFIQTFDCSKTEKKQSILLIL